MAEPSTAPCNIPYTRLVDTAPSKYDAIRAVLTTTKAKIITVIVASTLIITAVLITLDVEHYWPFSPITDNHHHQGNHYHHSNTIHCINSTYILVTECSADVFFPENCISIAVNHTCEDYVVRSTCKSLPDVDCFQWTTHEPTTQPTFNPTTSTPTTSQPTTASPTTLQPTTVNPTTATPTTFNPTTSQPTTSKPTINPITTSPTTDNPTTAQPTTSTPTTAQPTTAQPTTSKPTVSPTTANPTTAQPTTSNPTTAHPTTSKPTVSPTTANPTTLKPTPVIPTTAAPTVSPTTFDPTTYNPTSSHPTTAQPTLFVPTTATPTTTVPTSANPTTYTPTTFYPTTLNPTTLLPTLSPTTTTQLTTTQPTLKPTQPPTRKPTGKPNHWPTPRPTPKTEDRCKKAGEKKGLNCCCMNDCGGRHCDRACGRGFGIGGYLCGKTQTCCCGCGCNCPKKVKQTLTTSAPITTRISIENCSWNVDYLNGSPQFKLYNLCDHGRSINIKIEDFTEYDGITHEKLKQITFDDFNSNTCDWNDLNGGIYTQYDGVYSIMNNYNFNYSQFVIQTVFFRETGYVQHKNSKGLVEIIHVLEDSLKFNFLINQWLYQKSNNYLVLCIAVITNNPKDVKDYKIKNDLHAIWEEAMEINNKVLMVNVSENKDKGHPHLDLCYNFSASNSQFGNLTYDPIVSYNALNVDNCNIYCFYYSLFLSMIASFYFVCF